MSKVYLFCADGFEEVEGLTAVDLLRRAGCEVKLVSIMGRKAVTGSHDIKIETDMLFEEIREDADMYVLPGGLPGTTYLKEHEELADLLRRQYEKGASWLCAICAAPSVFEGLGFLKGRRATSYPGCLSGEGVTLTKDPVEVDGRIVTSRGVGTAIPIALKLISLLKGEDEAKKIAESILYC